MRTNLPEPLALPWELKEHPSAKSGYETLPDGRTRYWVDEILPGITPRMLVWWFSHLDGDMDIDGHSYPRYRVWHPFDHVYAVYVRRCPDGSIGPGAQIANLEYLARNPRYKVRVVATVERLDEEIFIHNVVVAGLHVVRMEHIFEQVQGGTRFGHFMYVPGAPTGRLGNAAVTALFSHSKGQAWLKHAIEEMGNLENFLPALYERELGITAEVSRPTQPDTEHDAPIAPVASAPRLESVKLGASGATAPRAR